MVFADPNSKVNASDPDHTQYSTCWDYTFVDQSNGGSPLDDDCRQLAVNIHEGGYWEVEGGGTGASHQHQLAQYGTCAFGVEKDGGGDGWYYVGNEDIEHVIYQSIMLFGTDRVAAYGYMQCAAYKSPPRVKWGIYHN